MQQLVPFKKSRISKQPSRRRGRRPGGAQYSDVHGNFRMPSQIVPLLSDVTLHTPIPLYVHNATGTTITDQFIANSPYHTDGVNSSVNLSTISGLYYSMLVTASKISLNVTNTSVTVPLIAVLYPSISAAPATTYGEARAQRFSKCVEVAPQGSGPNVKKLESMVDLKAFLGLPSLTTSDMAYTSQPLTQPIFTVYWHIFYSSSDSVGHPQFTVQCDVFFKTRLFLPLNNTF